MHKPNKLPDTAVSCPHCGYTLFDGEVVRSRVVKPLQGTALCKCKKWVPVPISYKSNHQPQNKIRAA